MDQLLTNELKRRKALIGFVLLLLGFLNLNFGWIAVLSPYSLAITGLIAFFLTFGKEARFIIGRPKKPIKYFFAFFFLTIAASFCTSFLLQMLLKLKLAGNPISGHVPWLQLPVMLLGEELISFFIFIVTATMLKRHTHNLLIANIVSAVIFAVMHIPTYWNGHLLMTLLHVLALQGISRIIFNTAGVKSNTLVVPWVIHVAFDIIMLLLPHYL